jgi:uncharacterized protein (TIGR03083 family)
MIDYLNSIRTESTRFGELVRSVNDGARIPSCPEWSVADLTWHLAEVQYFWAGIVAGLLESPKSLPDLERPTDAALPDLFDEQAARLVAALESRRPEDVCWSWHDAGHSVGWVLRRQAHEALIHRIDAELAAGTTFKVDAELAADGVDEVLTVMLDATDLPEWATFSPDGTTATIGIEDGAGSWSMALGRFSGTSPVSGNTYNNPALRLTEVARPTTEIRGTAADLDLWLWGRGSLDTLSVEGDRDVARHLRAAAADGTQ